MTGTRCTHFDAPHSIPALRTHSACAPLHVQNKIIIGHPSEHNNNIIIISIGSRATHFDEHASD